jgi:hypothetical protein
MMSEPGQKQQIDFTVDKNNLYREESFTDLKVASIRRLIPVNPDGTDDKNRTPIFLGHTQLMSPDGPVPIQSSLAANNLEVALEEFPGTMQQAFASVVERIREMQQQQQMKQKDESRIIVPGR